jgi:hypothetical protein
MVTAVWLKRMKISVPIKQQDSDVAVDSIQEREPSDARGEA